MSLFAVGNGLAALAPGFGTLLAARFLSGLPHGAFFGVAALVAADLARPARRASAVGWLFLGLTVANLVGVPAATVFGGVLGWRLAFALIAGVALLCVAGMLLTVPRDAGGGGARSGCGPSSAVFRRPAVLLALAMVVFGCGGLFTFSTYIAPMTTEVTGWSPAAVPVMLALLGLGMTAGTFLGGRLADRMDSLRAAVVVLGAQAVVLLGAVAAVHSRVLAPVAAFAVGALSLALVPVVQTVVVDAAPGGARSWRRRRCSRASTSRTHWVRHWAAGAGRRAGLRRAARGRGGAGGGRRRNRPRGAATGAGDGCNPGAAGRGRGRRLTPVQTSERRRRCRTTARAVAHLVGPAHLLCRVRCPHWRV